MNGLSRWLISCTFALAGNSAFAAEVLVIDTRDAFERSVALKALFIEVDSRAKLVREDYEKTALPLTQELEQLRQSGEPPDNTRKRKAELLFALGALQKTAALKQQAIGKANETALAGVEAAITAIESELKQQHGAAAVVRAQETLYYRPDCGCNVTEELYQLLNIRVPKVNLP